MKNNKVYRLVVSGVEQGFRSKMFIILNIIILLVTMISVNFETVTNMFESKSGGKEKTNIIVYDETGKIDSLLQDSENLNIVTQKEENKENIELHLMYDSVETVKVKLVSNEKISNTIYSEILKEVKQVKKEIFSQNNDVTLGQINQLERPIAVENVLLNMDDSLYNKYEFIIPIIGFSVYMLFIFIATSIASTIGIEKISKTTEYMLTGMNEKQYLWSNILQVILLFILEIVLSCIYFVMATMINAILVNQTAMQGSINILSMIDPTILNIVLYAVVQCILSILILSIVQAVVTSKSSNMSDVSNSTMVTIFVAIIISFASPALISQANVVSLPIKLISMLPLFSTTMVPKLMLLGQISVIEIIFSIVISAIGVFFASKIGSKMFKKGLLNITESKKENKKEEIEKLDHSKFKSTMFRVSFAIILSLLFSNFAYILLETIEAYFKIEMSAFYYIKMIIVSIVTGYIPYLYLKKSSFKPKNQVKKLPVNKCISYVGIGLFFLFVIQLISNIIMNKLGIKFEGLPQTMYDYLDSGINKVLFVILLSVVPAIFEELFYRKGIITITKRYGMWFSIMISSVAFGLVHGNIIQSIFAVGTGIIFGFIYLKTNRLGVCMLLHFINNLYGALAVLTNNSNILTVIALILAALGFIVFIVSLAKPKEMYGLEKEGSIKISYSSILTEYSTIFVLLFYIVTIVYTYVVFN